MYMEDKLGGLRIPAWIQMVKLGTQGFLHNCIAAFSVMSKIFYTLYAALIIVVTLLPTWLFILFVSQSTAQNAARIWCKFILKAMFCRVTVVGEENLTQASSVIFAVNHASYIDSIVMMSIAPKNVRFVGKKELMNSSFLRSLLSKLELLTVDRLDFSKGMEDTKRIEDSIQQGNSIVIYPEGTFSYASGLRPFRLGAFKIAAETNVPICPVALAGTRNILRDDEKTMRPGKITVTICPLVQPVGAEWSDVTQLRNEVRAQIAKYCGEPSLDFIVAQTVAEKPPAKIV